MYYDEIANKYVFDDSIPYIPTEDGNMADPIMVKKCEKDHVNDFRKWLDSSELLSSLKAIEPNHKYGFQTKKSCENNHLGKIAQFMKEEYKRIKQDTINRYDTGENPPHVIKNNYPTTVDSVINCIQNHIINKI